MLGQGQCKYSYSEQEDLEDNKGRGSDQKQTRNVTEQTSNPKVLFQRAMVVALLITT